MKQAILAVSFGTAHPDTLEKTISPTEAALRAEFPELPVLRAFTSPTIRKKLAQEQEIRVPSVEEVLEQLVREGCEQVLVQPTLLLEGFEYDRLKQTLEGYRSRIGIRLGRPLLWEGADLGRAAAFLRECYAPDPDTVLLMMGHGTEHPANGIYNRLGEQMKALDGACLRLCTVEGVPTFADAVAELQKQSRRKVILAPLLLVAGEHAKNDMAGPQPESLRSMLEAAGFCVECRLQGLGEQAEIRRIYCERLRGAEAL